MGSDLFRDGMDRHNRIRWGAGWDESKHPRGEDGKWGPGGAPSGDGGEAPDLSRMTTSELRDRVRSAYLGIGSVLDGSRRAGFTDDRREAEKADAAGLSVHSVSGKSGKDWYVYESGIGSDEAKALRAHLREKGYGSTLDDQLALSRLAGYGEDDIAAYRELLRRMNPEAHDG